MGERGERDELQGVRGRRRRESGTLGWGGAESGSDGGRVCGAARCKTGETRREAGEGCRDSGRAGGEAA